MDDSIQREGPSDVELVLDKETGEFVEPDYTSEKDWWPEHEATGRVSPLSLAPTKGQVRRYINTESLRELYESIKVNGVSHRMLVTPRHLAPWAEAEPGYEDAYFAIVGGHRRHEGALKAGLDYVPIEVKVYSDEASFKEAALLHNDPQDPLQPLEDGFAIVDLLSLGRKKAYIQQMFPRMTDPTYYGRINLTKLCPQLMKFLTQKTERASRKDLTITVAEALGGSESPSLGELRVLYERFEFFLRFVESGVSIVPLENLKDPETRGKDDLRFALQRLLFVVLRRQKFNASLAVKFVKKRMFKERINSGTGQRKKSPTHKSPRHVKSLNREQKFAYWLETLEECPVEEWRFKDYVQAFGGTSRELLGEYAEFLRKHVKFTQDAIVHLERLREDKRKLDLVVVEEEPLVEPLQEEVPAIEETPSVEPTPVEEVAEVSPEIAPNIPKKAIARHRTPEEIAETNRNVASVVRAPVKKAPPKTTGGLKGVARKYDQELSQVAQDALAGKWPGEK